MTTAVEVPGGGLVPRPRKAKVRLWICPCCRDYRARAAGELKRVKAAEVTRELLYGVTDGPVHIPGARIAIPDTGPEWPRCQYCREDGKRTPSTLPARVRMRPAVRYPTPRKYACKHRPQLRDEQRRLAKARRAEVAKVKGRERRKLARTDTTRKLEHARAMLSKARTREKRAVTLRKKWEKAVRRLERKAGAGGAV